MGRFYVMYGMTLAEGGCPGGADLDAYWTPLGLVLLGAPLGDEDELAVDSAPLGGTGFVSDFLRDKLAAYRRFLEAVETVVTARPRAARRCGPRRWEGRGAGARARRAAGRGSPAERDCGARRRGFQTIPSACPSSSAPRSRPR